MKQRLTPVPSKFKWDATPVNNILTHQSMDGVLSYRIIKKTDEELKVKFLSVTPHYGTYVDVGETYTFNLVFKESWLEKWCLSKDQVKRKSSQFFIYHWLSTDNQEESWSPELDF